MSKIHWGVLSTARIGVEKVIPAMQKGIFAEIVALASRDIERAQKVAVGLRIPKAYGSYEELLADKEIEAVYIPLPNHLHVEWTLKSLEAGKHVLCEKPLGLDLKQVEYLQDKVRSFPSLIVMEAFMYRFHPQWQAIRKLIDEGRIGELRHIHSFFSYFNINPMDIRNKAEIGGGGLLDIGCYCISLSRFLFKDEPHRVFGSIEYDPKLKIDRLTSGVLEFEKGTSTFTCSTQLSNHQFADVLGTRGKIEIENPFTPSPENSTTVVLHGESGKKEIAFEACNQYTIQGEMFSQAIINKTAAPTPLEDAVANMRVIDRIVESAQKGGWVKI
jgi:predicted dehydrogenase